jgi:hypothetical protein
LATLTCLFAWLDSRAAGSVWDDQVWLFAAGTTLLFCAPGGLIVAHRPANPIGWLLCAIGLIAGVAGAAGGYGEYAVDAPGRILALWIANVLGLLILAPMPLLFLLFPDGRPPSRWWWPVGWLTAVASAGLALGPALYPGPLGLGTEPANPPNPMGIAGAEDLMSRFFFLGAVLLLMAAALALAAVSDRFQRARGIERQQLKWFLYGAVALIITLLFGLVPAAEGITAIPALAGFGVYTTCVTVAILRHRLYDIDLLITRTLVYGLLTAAFTAVYLAIVVGIGTLVGSRGESNLLLSIVATALIAVAFQPARERSRRLANRLVYGKRATPSEVLSAFSQAMAGASTDDSLLRMARLVVEATGAVQATVWLRLGDLLQSAGLLAPGRASARAHRARRARRPGGPGHDTAQEQEVSGRIRGRPARGAHGNGLPPRAPHPRRREADRRPGRPDRTGPSLPAHEGARPVRQGARLLPPTGGRRAGRGVTLGAVAAGGAGGHHLVLRHPRLLLPGRAAPAAGGGRGGWAPPCRHG